MLPLYYYNKVEIASVFHIHVRRMWKTHRSLHHHPRRGRACPARNLPAACRQSFYCSPIPPNHLTPQPTCHPPPPIICARQPPSPQYAPCPNFILKLCRKNQKTCKNLLTKVILLAIIIKLSREPSPRRQPLEPLPTACTPFFEENFFKKLSENLLTNERI